MIGFHPSVEIFWLDSPKIGKGELASAARWCEWMRKDESNTIGFLPSAERTYRRAAELGRLCLALENDFLMPLGFLYFGIRNRTLRIQQVAVLKTMRRRGIGTAMIAAAMTRYTDDIDRIALKCRDGLPAVNFWKCLGFIPGETREHVGARGKPVREYTLEGSFTTQRRPARGEA